MAIKFDSINSESPQSHNLTSSTGATASVPGPLKSILEKALDEVSRGNPEEGERLIELALLKDADTSLVIAEMLEALHYQEMADADPAASRRKGYYEESARLRRAAIAKATGGAT
jgi:hypothetical protein